MFVGRPFNREIKGIRFLHVPKCGGTFLTFVLSRMCEDLGIDYTTEGHAFHRDIDGGRFLDDGYLTVSSVRHPLDLLVSVFFHHGSEGQGFGLCAEPFMRAIERTPGALFDAGTNSEVPRETTKQALGRTAFKDFFYYFCFLSDFTYCRDVWPFTREVYHYYPHAGDEDALAQNVYAPPCPGRNGRLSGWKVLQTLLLARPHPWKMLSVVGPMTARQTVEYPHSFLAELQASSFPISSQIRELYEKGGVSSLLTSPYPRRMRPSGELNRDVRQLPNPLACASHSTWPIFGDDVRFPLFRTWSPVLRDQGQLEINKYFQDMLEEWGWSLAEANEFWHFSANMWCQLFNFEERALLPDVILRLENIENGIRFLAQLLGITDAQKYIDLAHNDNRPSGTRGWVNKSPRRYDGGDFLQYYDESMLKVAQDMLLFEHTLFGYTVTKPGIDLTHEVLINDNVKVNFLPREKTVLSYKWMNPDGA